MKVAKFPENHVQEDAFIGLARSALSDVFPNPARVGCPDVVLRKALARRKKDILQHWDVLDHICTCSPCFSEHLAFRNRVYRRETLLGIFGLAVIALGLAGAYTLWQLHWRPVDSLTIVELRKAIPPGPVEPTTSVTAASLNFANWALNRSSADRLPLIKPPVLKRGKLSLTIQLPLMSQPGTYRVVLSTVQGSSLIDRSVRARMVDGSTTLDNIEVDTTAASSGMYTLIVLRGNRSVPRKFPVRIE